MKNIEDYWFICVTDERLEKESLADLIRVLEQHLPYLLDGIINSQDEHVRVHQLFTRVRKTKKNPTSLLYVILLDITKKLQLIY